MDDHTITLTLPVELYQRFQQHALGKHLSVEEDFLLLAIAALAKDEIIVGVQQREGAPES